MTLRKVSLCALILAAQFAWGAPSPSWDFGRGRVGWMGIFESGGQTTHAPLASWMPSMVVTDSYSVGWELGVGFYKQASGSNKILVDWIALQRVRLCPAFTLEFGPGVQFRAGDSQYGLLSLGGSYTFSQPLLKVWSGLSASYATVWVSGRSSHLVKAGLLLQF